MNSEIALYTLTWKMVVELCIATIRYLNLYHRLAKYYQIRFNYTCIMFVLYFLNFEAVFHMRVNFLITTKCLRLIMTSYMYSRSYLPLYYHKKKTRLYILQKPDSTMYKQLLIRLYVYTDVTHSSRKFLLLNKK